MSNNCTNCDTINDNVPLPPIDKRFQWVKWHPCDVALIASLVEAVQNLGSNLFGNNAGILPNACHPDTEAPLVVCWKKDADGNIEFTLNGQPAVQGTDFILCATNTSSTKLKCTRIVYALTDGNIGYCDVDQILNEDGSLSDFMVLGDNNQYTQWSLPEGAIQLALLGCGQDVVVGEVCVTESGIPIKGTDEKLSTKDGVEVSVITIVDGEKVAIETGEKRKYFLNPKTCKIALSDGSEFADESALADAGYKFICDEVCTSYSTYFKADEFETSAKPFHSIEIDAREACCDLVVTLKNDAGSIYVKGQNKSKDGDVKSLCFDCLVEIESIVPVDEASDCLKDVLIHLAKK